MVLFKLFNILIQLTAVPMFDKIIVWKLIIMLSHCWWSFMIILGYDGYISSIKNNFPLLHYLLQNEFEQCNKLCACQVKYIVCWTSHIWCRVLQIDRNVLIFGKTWVQQILPKIFYLNFLRTVSTSICLMFFYMKRYINNFIWFIQKLFQIMMTP